MMGILTKMRQRWRLVLGLSIVGLVASAALLIAGAGALAYTSTEAFCIGCHEMKNNVYAEYKGTIHDTNRTGVHHLCRLPCPAGAGGLDHSQNSG
jgi:cytochrome c-type protein NapC